MRVARAVATIVRHSACAIRSTGKQKRVAAKIFEKPRNTRKTSEKNSWKKLKNHKNKKTNYSQKNKSCAVFF